MTQRIEKLRRDHAVDVFDCGREEFNRFLHQHALQNQHSGGSQTYVARVHQTVAGDFALAVGSVEQEEAPERVKKGWLAVDRHWQKRGIGAGLLKDATVRTLQAADIAGIRALVVRAKDDEAKGFYQHFNFMPSPSDPLHLFMLLKDIRQIVL